MYIYYSILAIALIGIDIWAKWLTNTNMEIGQKIPLINGVFNITYVVNTGAAFSMFSNNTSILTIITAIVIIGIILYVIIKQPKNRLLMISLTLIIAGGIGNLIERITLGHVTDFFDFCLINFAIFNTADTFVVCGTILLMLYILFFEKKEGEKAIEN